MRLYDNIELMKEVHTQMDDPDVSLDQVKWALETRFNLLKKFVRTDRGELYYFPKLCVLHGHLSLHRNAYLKALRHRDKDRCPDHYVQAAWDRMMYNFICYRKYRDFNYRSKHKHKKEC